MLVDPDRVAETVGTVLTDVTTARWGWETLAISHTIDVLQWWAQFWRPLFGGFGDVD